MYSIKINLNFFRTNKIRVINCTTGGLNGIDNNTLIQTAVKYSREYPTKHTILYPYVYMESGRIRHTCLQYVQSLLPAYFADWRLQLAGKKPMAVRIHKTVKSGLRASKQKIIHFY